MTPDVQDMGSALLSLADGYERDVLGQMGFLSASRPSVGPSRTLGDLKESIALKYAAEATRVIRQPKDNQADIDKRTSLCLLIQDWLNEYVREWLGRQQALDASYDRIPLDHPFYQSRWDFIDRHVAELMPLLA